MKQNDGGFGLAEGILILGIVGLLGFVGWYIWNSNKDKPISMSSSLSEKKSTAEIPSGWTNYQNTDLGISFAYPKSWALEDKSKEPTSTKSHNIGELTSDDRTTTVAITLVRKKDGRNVYSSIDGWKNYAKDSNIKYSNLTEIKSSYISFSYVLDVGGATGLVYQILNPADNTELVVLPTATSQKATIEQIISTLRLG